MEEEDASIHLEVKAFQEHLKSLVEVYTLKVKAVKENLHLETHPEIRALIEEYKDVIPECLPAELPPSRQVEFDIDLKSEAKPNSRSPFCLSKTEQDSLESFVSEFMQKGWIEISDSP